MGRPTDYNVDLTAEICALLAEGNSLLSICRADGMPAAKTVYSWLITYPEFMQQYSHAREDQADTYADEIIDIADNVANDTTLRLNPDGSTTAVANHEWINRSRLRVDARKWVAAKMKPKKYAEHIKTEHTGADGGPLVISWLKNEES